MKNINDLNIEVSEEIRKYTSHSSEIAIMIINYLRQEGLSKSEFAEKVDKSPSEITRWLSGNHNFTIMTLALIEAKTGVEIVRTLLEKEIKSHLENQIFIMPSCAELEFQKQELIDTISQLEENLAVLSQEQIVLSKIHFWNSKNYNQSSTTTKTVLTTKPIVFGNKKTEFSITASDNVLPVHIKQVQLTN